jgi:hypothetical protein
MLKVALAFAAVLLTGAALPAAAQGLPELMRNDEAARPGPTSSQAEPGAAQGTGTAITRSLRPEADADTPYVGPGEAQRVPVPEALDMLKQAQDGVAALQQKLATAPPAQDDPTGGPLGQEAQKVLLQAQHAVQALQHSGAVPSGSQEVRDTLLTITESLNTLVQDPAKGGSALATLQAQLGSLTASAEQAMAPRDER